MNRPYRAARPLGSGLAVLACLAAPYAAHAQIRPQPIDPNRPLIMRAPADAPVAARAMTPLDPIQMQIVQDVAREREAGRFDMARKKLSALPASTQRHPIVLTERARTELAAGNNPEVIRLATSERRAQRDSLLLGHELVEACERLNRMREASVTAVEVWAMAPVEENWAMSVLTRLAHLDGHAGRDAMRKAFAREPRRGDLARGLAYLEWAAGDLKAAIKPLRSVEQLERGPRQRWAFAEMMLQTGTLRDSTGAADVYADVAADRELESGYRMTAARRGWELAGVRGQQATVAPKLYASLKDIPSDRWMSELSLALARALRLAGDTESARTLLGPTGTEGASRPEVTLERSLADLRDGPPERVVESLKPGELASDEQKFHYAEALFFAGQPDSALGWYKQVAENPGGPWTGASLERIFLIEDGSPKSALPVLGRVAYEQWRGRFEARAGAGRLAVEDAAARAPVGRRPRCGSRKSARRAATCRARWPRCSRWPILCPTTGSPRSPGSGPATSTRCGSRTTPGRSNSTKPASRGTLGPGMHPRSGAAWKTCADPAGSESKAIKPCPSTCSRTVASARSAASACSRSCSPRPSG